MIVEPVHMRQAARIKELEAERDRLRESNAELVSALTHCRQALFVAVHVAWQDATDDEVNEHVAVKEANAALAKAAAGAA